MIRVSWLALLFVIAGCRSLARSPHDCAPPKHVSDVVLADAALLQGAWDLTMVDTTIPDRSVIRARVTRLDLALHLSQTNETLPLGSRRLELIGSVGSQPVVYGDGALYFGWGRPIGDHPHALTHTLLVTRVTSARFEGTWRETRYELDQYVDRNTGKTYPPAGGYFCATRSR